MATSKEVAAEIQKIEQLIAPMEVELEQKLAAFADSIPVPAAEWIKAEVRRKIGDNADSVTEAGEESLRALKTDVAELINALPELAKKVVASKAEWPHLQKKITAHSYFAQSKQEYFREAFGRLIGHLGPILSKHNLLNAKEGKSGDWERVSGGYSYRYHNGFDEKKFVAVTEYTTIFSKYVDQKKAIVAKQEELKRIKATELYDEL